MPHLSWPKCLRLAALGLELNPVPHTLTAAELARQERADALADLLSPQSPASLIDERERNILEQYVEGQISISEAIRAFDKRSAVTAA